MGISIRVYVFQEDGQIKRVPLRVHDKLPFGEDAMPEYAGTRQRVATVVLDNENGKPVRILDATGSYWTFDEEGRIDEALRKGAWDAVETGEAVQRAARATVVDLRPQLRRKEWEKQNRWVLSKDDLDRIAADIWPRLAGPELAEIATVKGKVPKKPSLTYEARLAIEAASESISTVRYKLDDLSEPALKGFAFEARRHAKMGEGMSGMWEAVAAVADTQREIKARRRRGDGVWYALCRITLWNEDHTRGREIDHFEEKCRNKKEAVEAARRLLAQHAHKFDSDIEVEAEVVSDLEWEERALEERPPDASRGEATEH